MPRLSRDEPMVLNLGSLTVLYNMPDIHDGPGPKWATLRSQQLSRDRVGFRRCRAHILERVLLDSCHANPVLTLYSRHVIDDDLHLLEVDGLDVGPSCGQELND